MSSRLPIEVSPYRLVEQRKTLTGEAPIEQMTRLADLLVSTQGNATIELEFTRNDTGLPIVKGSINATLDVICQRCLKSVQHEVDSSIYVVLVKNDEQEAERVQEGFESWLVDEESEKMRLLDFIEDEILLALPFSVMHEQCEPARPLIEALPEDELLVTEAEPKENPFSVLQSLKDSE
ncbi:MAG: Unknown protein [uncultured Thiotrichaceae bacterium]|uniref:Large ribosomal RNA subunit accumulation protein YceD n=1 Tax=uncultured Thiotrichaceae bacterium TaxID=298394 RepID=A0A6S6T8G9_9GAMM|nr:MAG: Unknown protein [uncultured Thiotrichaceae bacterium]